MNFLAHLWLVDQSGADLAGALLGDWRRGALPPDMPPALAHSVRLHRRIDAVTDAIRWCKTPAPSSRRARAASAPNHGWLCPSIRPLRGLLGMNGVFKFPVRAE